VTRERLDVDVLIVGGGPAGLSAALRLAQLQSRGGTSLSVAVLEKAREAGAHTLSGAVLDPSALRDLLPDFLEKGAPLGTPVREDRVLWLTRRHHISLPLVPPPLRNHGNYVVSLSDLVVWLAAQVEQTGVDLFTGFAAQELLLDGRTVVGVRTGDRGVSRTGQPRPNFEAGVDVHARVTILCDGVRGNLTKALVRSHGLAREGHPQQYAVGLKELWEVPGDRCPAGTVMHTLGYPLRREEFGGGFVYGGRDGQVSVGLVAGLDYRDPRFDPHAAFGRFKEHPFVASLLRGGRLVRFGAKALPEGGWHTVPRLVVDGAVIAGDAAGLVNSVRLKGIHLAMRSGMLAAEAAYRAVLAGSVTAASLGAYVTGVVDGAIGRELRPVRNVHQAFGYGVVPGILYAGLAWATGGRLPGTLRGDAGHRRMRTLQAYYGDEPQPVAAQQPDRELTFDKATSVHYAGAAHEEDQPSHLVVNTDPCRTVCGEAFGHPCVRFCPANVYEIVREPSGAPRLHINASNCVHCKTCDIMDPYEAITWVPPEGGGGPQYRGM
jgi:electron-transferring-flavoprotein dehydrogenase